MPISPPAVPSAAPCPPDLFLLFLVALLSGQLSPLQCSAMLPHRRPATLSLLHQSCTATLAATHESIHPIHTTARPPRFRATTSVPSPESLYLRPRESSSIFRPSPALRALPSIRASSLISPR
ncbi:hypothetical protein A0H81_08172 [Grifola frondosa]|uniref:Secreted protein n=1 Tax=Grifola frondosa TaxID=5627 RepID=A0A1C7M5W4_GRIFR|nr:hypothetical protein A0H81_08172 [Grifola frondosa]